MLSPKSRHRMSGRTPHSESEPTQRLVCARRTRSAAIGALKRSRQMKAAIAWECPWVVLLTMALCSCVSPPEEPAWVPEARKIKIGMTRMEAEAHLPAYATIDMSFGSTGNHRDFYSIGEHWRVALVYRAPIETNLYFTEASNRGQKVTRITRGPPIEASPYSTEVSTNGQEVARGPLNGWIYSPTTNQPVIAGPFITYVRSRGSQFADPFGSFTAKVPIRREPDGPANASQPSRSAPIQTPVAAGSHR